MKAATLLVAALLCFALCAFAAADAVPLADNHVDNPVLLDATNTTAIVSLTNDIPDSSFTISVSGNSLNYPSNVTIPLIIALSYNGKLVPPTFTYFISGNSTLGFGFGIPPCSTYNNFNYGNKTGEWSVNATFAVPAEYPDAHAALTITFGAEAANLPDQGVLYSVTSYAALAYVNFVLPTFNESYTGYQVNFTVSTAGESLAELGNVTFTSSTSCILDGSAQSFVPPTNVSTYTASLSLGAGTWQSTLLSSSSAPQVYNVQWTATLVDAPPKSDSWWTTTHIIIVSAVAVGVVLVLLIAVAGVVWYMRRNRSYDSI